MNNPQRKLDAVIAATHAVLYRETFADSARAIFDHCCHVTGATSGYVALLSADGSENEVLFLESGGEPCTVDESLPMPIRGLRSEAYHTHKAVYDNDFMNSKWVDFMPGGHMALRNVMFAPLNVEGKTVGIMGLANKPSDFNDDDAEIASVLGELASVALMNSRHIDLLKEKTRSLELALSQVKTLHGLLPICAQCKSIRNDDGFWTRVEAYLVEHTDAEFSHGLCPDCFEKAYGDLDSDD